MAARVVMSDVELRRAVIRIAHEIVENTRGTRDLVLVGVHSRGVPLARRLADTIAGFEPERVPVGELDISLHRDDLATLGTPPRLQRTHIPVNVTGKRVVLVDDVLYTGRTVRAAMDALNDFGRPQRIMLAVMVDRGHRELPIRPDFVGRNLPTARREQIQVQFAETDGQDRVLLISPEGE